MTERGGASWKKTALVCGAILLAAVAAMALIFKTEPKAQRGGASKKTAMLVEVTGVERGTFSPTFVVTGTVRAEEEIILASQVGGQVRWLAPELTPGGFAAAGQPLVRIDARDYKNTVAQRQSALRQAETALQLELGRQDVAVKDYELLDRELGEEQRALVLRKPQLEAAKVQVEAARAAVDQARLDLQRTTIEAPFEAQVLAREVNVGSQVAPGDPLARLVGMDTYWVEATVPLSNLQWMSFPEADDDKGSPVALRNRTSWPEDARRSGHLFRLIGALDSQTRMARVLVAVPDPLAREEQNAGKPKLIVGEFLSTRIEGDPIPDVVRLDRAYLRDRDTVWLMRDGKLEIRPVEVLVRDERYAYVTEGLEEGDSVVTTNLATVTEGAPLRLEGGK